VHPNAEGNIESKTPSPIYLQQAVIGYPNPSTAPFRTEELGFYNSLSVVDENNKSSEEENRPFVERTNNLDDDFKEDFPSSYMSPIKIRKSRISFLEDYSDRDLVLAKETPFNWKKPAFSDILDDSDKQPSMNYQVLGELNEKELITQIRPPSNNQVCYLKNNIKLYTFLKTKLKKNLKKERAGSVSAVFLELQLEG
jgi:hypothetical protein